MRRVVVEFTRTSIRALAVDGPLSQPRLHTFVAEPIAGEPIAEILRRTLAACQASKASLLTTIPREQVITRLLKFPSTKPDELAQMVQLSGKAQLPYPPDRAVADFQVVDQHAGMSTVQLVACHQDLIDRHLNLFRQEGLEPTWVVPSSWGCLAWYQRLGKSQEVREPVLLLNIDDDHTDLALIRQGRLIFSRSLSQGHREWQAGAEALGLLAQELERSLAGLLKELPGVEVASVVLTGLGPLDQWRDSFEQRLGKPVIIKHAHGALQFPKPMAELPASPVVVLGVAMAERQWLLSLLPREARQAQRHRRRMRELTLTGSLLFAALLLGLGVLSVHVSRQARFTAYTARALNELESITEQLKRKERDTRLIDGLLALRRRTAEMLTELFRLTAPEILFESVVFDRARGELVVRGSALMTRQVLDYIQRLESSDQWDRVELRYSTPRGVLGGARTDFEILLRSFASQNFFKGEPVTQ